MQTQEVARQFHDDGCVVVRGIFAASEIAAVANEIEDLIRTTVPRLSPGDVYFEQGPSRSVKSIFRIEQHSCLFRSLKSDDRLLEIVRAIFPDGEIIQDVVSFFGKPARDGSVTPPHQDN